MIFSEDFTACDIAFCLLRGIERVWSCLDWSAQAGMRGIPVQPGEEDKE